MLIECHNLPDNLFNVSQGHFSQVWLYGYGTIPENMVWPGPSGDPISSLNWDPSDRGVGSCIYFTAMECEENH